MDRHNETMRTYYERIDAETRAASAPNAANAAPLMPVCDHCHGTGKDDAFYRREYGTEYCYFCDGTGRERGTKEGFPAIIRPGHLGADESLPASAWPGGYLLAYYPCTYSAPFTKTMLDGTTYHGTEHAEMVGDVLCPDCATAELHAEDPDESLCFIANIEEEVSDHNLTCDNCYAVIAYQTYCHDCRESVDCDEDNPFHLCPKTEPYTVRYLTHCPGSDWIEWKGEYPVEGRDHAKSIATALRNTGNAAFVHYQPSRLDFPPVVEEEEN